jgi:hypothetical protein
MNQLIKLNQRSKDMFANMGCGYIEHITIYRKEGNKIFFSAGNGRFHMLEEELKEYKEDHDQ